MVWSAEEAGQRERWLRASRLAVFAARGWVRSQPLARSLPEALRDAALVEASVGFLMHHGLIVVADVDAFARYFQVDGDVLPAHLTPEVRMPVQPW